jgi:hypothetical protein
MSVGYHGPAPAANGGARRTSSGRSWPRYAPLRGGTGTNRFGGMTALVGSRPAGEPARSGRVWRTIGRAAHPAALLQAAPPPPPGAPPPAAAGQRSASGRSAVPATVPRMALVVAT